MTDEELQALMRQRGGLLSPNAGVMQGGAAGADDPQSQLRQVYEMLLPQMKSEQDMLNLRRWYMDNMQKLTPTGQMAPPQTVRPGEPDWNRMSADPTSKFTGTGLSDR